MGMGDEGPRSLAAAAVPALTFPQPVHAVGVAMAGPNPHSFAQRALEKVVEFLILPFILKMHTSLFDTLPPKSTLFWLQIDQIVAHFFWVVNSHHRKFLYAIPCKQGCRTLQICMGQVTSPTQGSWLNSKLASLIVLAEFSSKEVGPLLAPPIYVLCEHCVCQVGP